MNTVIDQLNLRPKSVEELTQILEVVIQELAIAPLDTISIFFDGTEVCRHQMQDSRVFWWGVDEDSTALKSNPVSLVSSN